MRVLPLPQAPAAATRNPFIYSAAALHHTAVSRATVPQGQRLCREHGVPSAGVQSCSPTTVALRRDATVSFLGVMLNTLKLQSHVRYSIRSFAPKAPTRLLRMQAARSGLSRLPTPCVCRGRRPQRQSLTKPIIKRLWWSSGGGQPPRQNKRPRPGLSNNQIKVRRPIRRPPGTRRSAAPACRGRPHRLRGSSRSGGLRAWQGNP